MRAYLSTEELKIKELLLRRSYSFDKAFSEGLLSRFFVDGASGRNLFENSYAQRQSLNFMRKLSKNYLNNSEFHDLDLHLMAYEYLVGTFLEKYVEDFKLADSLEKNLPVKSTESGLRSTEDLRKNLELQLIVLRTSSEIVPAQDKEALSALTKKLSSLIVKEKLYKREVERAQKLSLEVQNFSKKVFTDHEYLNVRNEFIEKLHADIVSYEYGG